MIWKHLNEIYSSHLCQKTDSPDPDPEKVAELYNSELHKVLDKHAPELCRAITLRSHAPWYTPELRDLECEKRRWECVYPSSGLEIHRQIYHEQCKNYMSLVDQHKTEYYKSKIESADQKQLFHLLDGMFKVKQISLLPLHTSAHELTEKFSTYFIEKIAKLLPTP